MIPPGPHYEPCQDFLLQGDIGFFPFVQITAQGEAGGVPNGEKSDLRGIPTFRGMETAEIVIEGVPYAARVWRGLGLVIDQTSELRNSEADNRVTVIPIVAAEDAGVPWEAAGRGEIVGAVPLPGAAKGSGVGGVPATDMRDLVALPRTAVNVSRALALEGRMMTLTPPMAVVLAAKLSEFYAERQWARLDHLGNVVGQTLVDVLEIGKINEPPPKAQYAILNFANHERLQVYLHHRGNLPEGFTASKSG